MAEIRVSTPLVLRLLELKAEAGLSDREIQSRAGVNKSLLLKWRKGSCPEVPNMEAMFGALGYKLVAVKMEDGE